MPTFAPTPQSAVVNTKVNNEQIAGNDIPTTAPGVQLVSIAGATGDAIDTVGDTLKVNADVNAQSKTSANTSVTSSTSDTILLPANANRRTATFYNSSTQILYLKFGVGSSTTSYTIQMAASSYYELPQPCYIGQINGNWASANGSVLISELSA